MYVVLYTQLMIYKINSFYNLIFNVYMLTLIPQRINIFRNTRFQQFWRVIRPIYAPYFSVTHLARGQKKRSLVSGTIPCYSMLLVILSLLARLSLSKTVSMGCCWASALPVLSKWTLMFIEDLFGSSWKVIIKTSNITQQYVEVW